VKAVLLGASRGMGRALARLAVTRGDRLFLIGRHEEDLAQSARDLEVRGQLPAGRIGVWRCDLADVASFGPALDAADQALDGFDTVVITGARFASQEALERDPELLRQMLDVNFTGTVLFCEEVRRRLLARGGGTLCVFSSVAGERGRKPVVLYGAAKAGLSRYLEGLDHKFRAHGLRVITVKPGFVKTSMTEGLRPPPFAGEPEPVAARILRALDRGTPVVYAPSIWRLIMLIIRLLPRTVMRRISF
jgi:decaprenylphospho-beta-D-erythro-pentofuranosid-2-ulose 2-reductase